ncbi:MAG: TlpA family protein disulfide reductase [Lachnospiraceae bacterium]|nr:TlpA family protein disulfide reductase [Lachnospiraceae bacterium]
MKRKYLMAALALSTASMLMLSGCSLAAYLDKQDQAQGPINQREDNEPQDDDTDEIVDEVADTDNSQDAENTANEADTTEEIVLSFDPADRPNCNEGTGTPRVLDRGDIAPDFTVTLTNGDTFTLSDHDGGTVLINFWATWCGPCVGELPDLGKLAEDDIENFDIVCINCGEDERTVDAFVNDEGYTFNIAYDPYYTVGDYYPTDGIPYSVIVKNGIICQTYLGAPPEPYEAYKSEVLKYMNE